MNTLKLANYPEGGTPTTCYHPRMMIRVSENELINPDLIVQATYEPEAVGPNSDSPFASLTLLTTSGEKVTLTGDTATTAWNALDRQAKG